MAQIIEGDNRGIHRGFLNNAPGLPPRFPALSGRGSSLSDIDPAFISNQSSGSPRGIQRQRQLSAYNVSSQEHPFQLSGIPEDNLVPIKRGSHRRSASDSFTFTYLENPGSMYRFSNIAEEDETEFSNEKVTNVGSEDGDQLNDLLEEIQHMQEQQNVPISARVPHSRLKFESANLNISGLCRTIPEDSFRRLHSVSENEFTRDGDPSETNDPKQAKRALSNRQSAQRSRVRKLQYIAELERIVNVLQMDVSSLSARVLYLKRQHVLLNIDNNTLKQRIAFYIQEKSLKDTQNETLMNDVKRLQKLHDLQVFNQQQNQQQQRPNIQRHLSLPTDFGVQMQQFSDSTSGLLESFANMSLHTSSRANKEMANKEAGSSELSTNIGVSEGSSETQTSSSSGLQNL